MVPVVTHTLAFATGSWLNSRPERLPFATLVLWAAAVLLSHREVSPLDFKASKLIWLYVHIALASLSGALVKTRLGPSPIHQSGPKPNNAQIEGALQCPITREAMTDPRVLSCGHSVDGSGLSGLLRLTPQLCPVCRRPILSAAPNFTLRSVLEALHSGPESQ